MQNPIGLGRGSWGRRDEGAGSTAEAWVVGTVVESSSAEGAATPPTYNLHILGKPANAEDDFLSGLGPSLKSREEVTGLDRFDTISFGLAEGGGASEASHSKDAHESSFEIERGSDGGPQGTGATSWGAGHEVTTDDDIDDDDLLPPERVISHNFMDFQRGSSGGGGLAAAVHESTAETGAAVMDEAGGSASVVESLWRLNQPTELMRVDSSFRC